MNIRKVYLAIFLVSGWLTMLEAQVTFHYKVIRLYSNVDTESGDEGHKFHTKGYVGTYNGTWTEIASTPDEGTYGACWAYNQGDVNVYPDNEFWSYSYTPSGPNNIGIRVAMDYHESDPNSDGCVPDSGDDCQVIAYILTRDAAVIPTYNTVYSFGQYERTCDGDALGWDLGVRYTFDSNTLNTLETQINGVNQNNACINEPITLSINNAMGNSNGWAYDYNYSYDGSTWYWVGGTANGDNTTDETITFTPTQTGNLYFRVRIDGGDLTSQYFTFPTVFVYDQLVTSVGYDYSNTDNNGNVTCFGADNGVIDVDFINGVTPVASTYRIRLFRNSGSGTEVSPATYSYFSGLAPGTYQIIIDAGSGNSNPCSYDELITITEPAQLNMSSIGITNVTCNGNNNGTIELSPSGGIGEWTVELSGPVSPSITTFNNALFTGLPPGSYTATLTDEMNCTINYSGNPIIITEPASISTSDVSTNVVCFGQNDGTITTTVTGGTGPYSYNLYDNAATMNVATYPGQGSTYTLTGISPGTYFVDIVDANGCGYLSPNLITITEPTAYTGSFSLFQNIECADNINGAIGLTSSGGTPPYTYELQDTDNGNVVIWTGSPSDSLATGLSAGNYYVLLYDANGCALGGPFEITSPPLLEFAYEVTNMITCADGEGSTGNGEIHIGGDGGVPPYEYSFTGGNYFGNSGDSIGIADPGIYDIVVRDANGCTQSSSVEVIQQGPLIVSPFLTYPITCNGWNNGTAIISYNTSVYDRGFNTFQYYLEDVNGNRDTVQGTLEGWFTGLAPGVYTVSMEDMNTGCKSNNFEQITIIEPDVLQLDSISQVNVICAAQGNGSIEVNVSGGTPNYTIAASMDGGAYFDPDYNIGNNYYFDGLTPGTYTVVVGDEGTIGGVSFAPTNFDFFYCTDTLVFTITEPDYLGVVRTNVTGGPVNCNNNGVIEATPFGGVPPFTMYLVDRSGAVDDTIQTINTNDYSLQTFTNVPPGEYAVDILDANGCTSQQFKGLLYLNAAPFTLELTSTASSPISCFGASDGSVTVLAQNSDESDTGPYTYSLGAINNGTNPTFSGLTAGTYTFSVEDVNGCVQNLIYTVNEPGELVLNQIAQYPASCSDGDGTVTVSASGGTAPYTYELNNTTSQVDDGYFTGIFADVPNVITITDANGCTGMPFEFTVPLVYGFEFLDAYPTPVSCYGGSDGEVLATVRLGTPPYQYTWSNGSTEDNITNLTAGVYSVTVEDAAGCVIDGFFNVLEPDAWGVELTSLSNVGCDGGLGNVSVAANGAFDGPITFSLDGMTYGPTNVFTGLSAGNFTAYAKDINDCIQTTNFTISNTSPIDATVSHQNVDCNGNGNGTATVTINSGTPPYTYLWNNGGTNNVINGLSGGTYTVTVTDANCEYTSSVLVKEPVALVITPELVQDDACNEGIGIVTAQISGGIAPYSYEWQGNNSLTNDTLFNLIAGVYTVAITDANSCTITSSVTVNSTSAPSAIVTNVENTACGQAIGSIEISTSGGSGPYTYTWSHDGLETSNIAENLSAGSYSVTVTDMNGCTSTAAGNVSDANGPAATVANITNSFCTNGEGAMEVNVTGGQTPYTYAWSHDAGLTGTTASNLTDGTYTVSVSDNNGCVDVVSGVVNFFDSPSPFIAINNPSSCGSSTGSISVGVNAGTGTQPFSYTWSHDAGITVATANGLAAGNYTITVLDANGCENVISETVTSTQDMTVSTNIVIDATCGQDNGSIDLNISGGSAPYTYIWSNGSTMASIINLSAGNYSVTVNDATGNCIAITSAMVNASGGPTVAFSTIQNTVCEEGNGSLIVTPSGGSAPYTYIWSNGLTTSNINGLNSGNYTVTVEDANGCVQIESQAIVLEGSPTLNLVNSENSACDNNTGVVAINVTGGSGPYAYTWSHDAGLNSGVATGLAVDIYQVTVTDSNGCTDTFEQIIQNVDSPMLSTTGTTNSTCGNDNGSISITTTSGTSPYSYIWSNGSTSEDLNGISAGSYTVTVTDANGCTNVLSETINDANGPIALLDGITNSFCTDDNGSFSVNVSGGQMPYTYTWSHDPSNNTSSASNLNSGPYSVSITDVNGCVDVVSGNIQYFDAPSPFVALSSPSGCGSPDGSISIGVTAGTGTQPFNYAWSHDGTLTTATANGLAGGSYTVTITDANNCTNVLTEVIGTSQDMTVVPDVITDASCGQSNGSVSLAISGGLAPYSFSWSNGSSSSAITGLNPGSYTVTVTDSNGICLASTTANITSTSGPSISFDDVQNTICEEGNGSLSVSPTGGTSPYNYVWSNGLTSSSITGLNSGNYTVTITDANGCAGIDNQSIVLENAPTLSLNTFTNSACTSNTGTVSVNLTGGTAPFTYQWSHDAGLNSNNAGSLPAAVYQVTVTDNNGCTSTLEQEVLNLTGPIVSTQNTNNSTCGNTNGSIDLNITSGATPYTFLWDNGQTNATITNISAGSYSITVTDANGCETLYTESISDSNGPSLDNVNLSPETCNNENGTATAVVSGGTAPYTFKWTNDLGAIVSTSATVTGGAGTYVLEILDANTCVVSQNVVITADSTPTIALDNSTPSSCGAAPDGSAQISVTGGVAPYSYLWDDPMMQTSSNPTGLVAGTYSLTVTDNTGCQATYSTLITSGAGFNTTINVNQSPTCNGETDGLATVNQTGGTAPFTYLWSNGQTNETANGLGAGNYEVTITDAVGCEATQLVIITEPAILNLAQGVVNQPSCVSGADGSVEVNATGGTAPYTYQWNDPMSQTSATAVSLTSGGYVVTVTDANNCFSTLSFTLTNPTGLSVVEESVTAPNCGGEASGSASVAVSNGTAPYTYLWDDAAFQMNSTAVNLVAGDYNVTVTDNNGCVETLMVTVPSTTVLSSTTVTSTDPLCNGGADGTLEVLPSGGTGGYSYTWSHDATLNTPLVNNLTAGSYEVTITDGNGCFIVNNMILNNPSAINIDNVNITPETCGDSNGSAIATVSGGTAPYTYEWATLNLGIIVSTTQSATGLEGGNSAGAGFYVLTITDANNCEIVQNVFVPEDATPVITLDNLTPSSCGAAPDGSIAISVTGGVTPYSYAWDDANMQTSATATGLAIGSYTVTVTDNSGCTTTYTNNITGGTGFSIDITSTQNVSCNGSSDGATTVSPNGGTAPYTYLWSNGATVASINTLSAGGYIVTIIDAVGCETTQNVVITEPNILGISQDALSSPTCADGADGLITVSGFGGTAPYIYQWDDALGQTTATANNLEAGDYNVTITDVNNCVSTQLFTLDNPLPLIVAESSIVAPSCAGEATGSAGIIVFGGIQPYSFLWDDPAFQMDATAMNLIAGDYNVTVIDAQGCSGTLMVTVPSTAELVASLGTVSNPSCNGVGDGSAEVIASGGTAPYTYLWDDVDGQMTAIATSLNPGNYTVTITDANNCFVQINVNITGTSGLTLSEDLVVNPSCNGDADGSASIQATGGTPPYTYLWNDALAQTNAMATGLVSGTYIVQVLDVNGCGSAINIDVFENATLIISEVINEGPSCIDGEDGMASVDVVGGNAPYSYLWNNGATDDTAIGLSAGANTVTVTDAAGCAMEYEFNLANASAYIVDLGASDTTLCLGDVFYFNGAGTGANYSWTGSNGFNSTDEEVLLTEEGTYFFSTTNASGCVFRDTITLNYSETILEPLFIMATDAVVGDTVLINEVSWPIPDSIQWTFKEDSVVLLYEDLNQYAFTFPDAGTFTIGMTAYYLDCSSYIEKEITIHPTSGTIGGPGSNPGFVDILDFEVYPNPSDGNFTVGVGLSAPQDIILRIYDIESNPITSWEGTSADRYDAPFSLGNVAPGAYVVLLQTLTERRTVTIVITKP